MTIENSTKQIGLASGIQQARLAGYINLLGMLPSFLVPVFEIDGELVIQESDSGGKIKAFYPFDEASLGEVERISSGRHVQEGDNVLYGFLFPDGTYAIDHKNLLAQRLLSEEASLSEYKFLYMEILDFLGNYEELEKELDKVEKLYANNRMLGKKWVRTERKFLEKKTILDGKALVKKGKSSSHRTQKVGVVSSDKMMKTVVVRVNRIVKHPKYHRYIRRQKKFMAHDELGAVIGDKVRIIETRPLSARKRWRVVEIIQRAKV